MKPVSLSWRDRPFDGAFHHALIEPPARDLPMPTIAEIVEKTPGLPRGFAELGEVRINGDTVPRHNWRMVRPRAGALCEVCVTLHMPIRGGGGSAAGGGSRKNTVALVATIAVLLVAAAVTGGAAAGLGGLIGAGLLASGSVSAAVAGAGVGIGGALLVSALFPPPSLSVNSAQNNALRQINSKPASLSGNAISPASAVPRVVGTMRVFPPVISPQLIAIANGKQYAEIVFGLAGPHVISGIQLDSVDATTNTLSDVEIEVCDGLPNSPSQTLVSRQGYTLNPAIALSKHLTDPLRSSDFILDPTLAVLDAIPQWHQFVTRNGPDELWINLNFSGGLNNSNGADMGLPFRVQIRPTGTSTWINLPEVHYQRKGTTAGPFDTEIRLKWSVAPSTVTLPADNTISASGWVYAHISTPTQTIGIGPNSTPWVANAYFSNGGAGTNYLASNAFGATSNIINVDLTVDRAIIYLDPATFPPGYYDVQVMRGSPYHRSVFIINNYGYTNSLSSPYTVTSSVVDFFWYWQNSTNGNPAMVSPQDNVTADVSIDRVASVWLQNPIQSDDFATISVRVHGRSFSAVSVLASGYVMDWDGTGWNTLTTTSNPAPHFRDVLGGNLGGSPLPALLIDDAGLVAWRTACISLSYECNAVVEGKTYIDVLNLIAAAGYARPRCSELWGVILDRDRSADSPVQIFTPRNMRGFTWTKAFVKQPTGMRVSYVNRNDNYNTDEQIVFQGDSQDASLLESISYDGLVTLSEITERAEFDMTQAALRFTFYTGDASLDALVCQRGDLVGVQHDILADRAGFVRISSVQTSGGMVMGLTFEGTAPVDTELGLFSAAHLFTAPRIFNLGSRTGCAIRLLNGNGVLLKEITGLIDDEITTVTFVTPFPDPGTSQLDADCLCAIGPLGSEYRRLLVYGISPKDDLTATLTFVDEAPELWT